MRGWWLSLLKPALAHVSALERPALCRPALSVRGLPFVARIGVVPEDYGSNGGARVGCEPSAPLTAKTLNARDLSSGPHGPIEAPAQAACTPGSRHALWGLQAGGGSVAMGSNPRWRRSALRRAPPTAGEALSRVLDEAEDASPLEAVEAVTARLSATLEASAAFFLIADISGRGLVRLSQASAGRARTAELGGPGGRPRLEDEEQAMDLPVNSGGPAGEALRHPDRPGRGPPGAQAARADQWEVLAPVTERGEALGLLRAVAAARAGRRRRWRRSPDRARAGVRGDRQPAAHRPVRVGAAQHARSPSPRRSSAGCCPRPSPARPGRSPCRRGWSPPPPSAGTPSTTAWPATSCTCR